MRAHLFMKIHWVSFKLYIICLYIYSHILSALLTGDMKMSAERCLTVWSLPYYDDTSADDIDNTNDVKSKMMKIINIALINIFLFIFISIKYKIIYI